MPAATLTLPATPELVRVARVVAVAAARRAGVAEEVIDDVRLAVGEATGWAVLRHREAGCDAPVRLSFAETPGLFEVVVDDFVVPVDDPAGHAPSDRHQEMPDGLGEAIMTGLPDRCDRRRRADGESIVLGWELATR